MDQIQGNFSRLRGSIEVMNAHMEVLKLNSNSNNGNMIELIKYTKALGEKLEGMVPAGSEGVVGTGNSFSNSDSEFLKSIKMNMLETLQEYNDGKPCDPNQPVTKADMDEMQKFLVEKMKESLGDSFIRKLSMVASGQGKFVIIYYKYLS